VQASAVAEKGVWDKRKLHGMIIIQPYSEREKEDAGCSMGEIRRM